MAKAKKPAKRKRRSPARKPAAKVPLGAFFRKLWSKRDLLEKFSASPQGRDEVLGKFNLSDRHREILRRGCMREIIPELAGVTSYDGNSTVVNSMDTMDCGHAECQAFSSAARRP